MNRTGRKSSEQMPEAASGAETGLARRRIGGWTGRRALGRFVGTAAGMLTLGCTPPPEPAPRPLLPLLPVEQVTTAPSGRPTAPSDDPVDELAPGPPITLSAVDVDVRVLLPAIAEAAGISLVLGPEVQGRVSVNLVEVPAREALRAILQQAELGILAPPVAAPWQPVVFYAIPVNVNTASVELIQARFGVSREVAEWIVQNRVR